MYYISLLESINTSLAVTSDEMSCSLTLAMSLEQSMSNILCPISSVCEQCIKLLTDSDTYRNLPRSHATTNRKQSALCKCSKVNFICTRKKNTSKVFNILTLLLSCPLLHNLYEGYIIFYDYFFVANVLLRATTRGLQFTKIGVRDIVMIQLQDYTNSS